jgi:hypothetical protein
MLASSGVRQQSSRLVHELGRGRAMRLHSHRVDDGIGAASRGAYLDLLHRVGARCVDRVRAILARELEALGNDVHREDPIDAPVPRDPHAHLADRAETVDGQASALGSVRVCDCLPRRWQDVREEEEAIIGRPLRDLDRSEVGHRDAQVLCLAPRDLAVQLRVSEECRALVVLPHLRCLTLREELAVAHPAVATGDVEGNDDTVAGADVLDLGPDLLDDPHWLVPEDVAAIQKGAHHFVQVQVRAADRRGGDVHHGIGRLFDSGIRDLLHANVATPLPDECLHDPGGMP